MTEKNEAYTKADLEKIIDDYPVSKRESDGLTSIERAVKLGFITQDDVDHVVAERGDKPL